MEIIIVTYNGMRWLPACLDSCKKYSATIVDNGSTDGTLDYIELTHPNVTVLKQDTNLGFGQANNVGIRNALERGVNHVFLLNQDAYLQEGCIERLLAVHLQYPEYGILSPIHLNGKGDRLDHYFSNYLRYEYNADFYSDFVLGKALDAVYPVPFVNAAGWLMSRELIDTVGGFDPIFFHYAEDDNYCQRVRYHGFKLGVVSGAFLFHDREERKPSGENYKNSWAQRERSLKTRYADINRDNLGDLEEALRLKKRGFVRTIMKFGFSKLGDLRTDIRRTERVLEEVSLSRKQNVLRGRNYL